MHPFHDTARSQHDSNASDSARSEQKHTASSSFVSTLSNALNISTPTLSRKANLASPAQSIPTLYTNAATPAHQPNPTRPADPPRILTLSGHEAFQSPTTPISSWTYATVENPLEPLKRPSIGVIASQDAPAPRGAEQNQDWLISGPSSRRIFNIFGSRSKTNATAAQAYQTAPSTDSGAVQSSHSSLVSSSSTNALARPQQSSTGPFHIYRQQPSSHPRVNTYNFSRAPSDVPTSQALLSPTSAAALSPTQFSLTFPAGFNDGSFISAMFEQDTPSLSTHLLPSQDLTEQLHPGSNLAALSAAGRPFSTCAPSFTFTMQPDQSAPNSQHDLNSSQTDVYHTGNPHDLVSDKTDTSKAATRTAASSASRQGSFSILQPAPMIASSSSVNAAAFGQDTHPSAQQAMRDDGHHAGNGLVSDGNRRTRTLGAEDIAGLGLQLNAVPVSQVEAVELIAPTSTNSYRSSVLVDEMGRWLFDSDGRPITVSDQTSLSTTDSSSRRLAWHGKDASSTSLGATTEASFTSHSNSSTWDTSFNDVSSSVSGPPLASADSQYIRTPASSIGLSFNQNAQLNKLYGRPSTASDSQPTQSMTPEVAMHDFSEFAQSVSIEQMADQRWRTWPRNRDSVLLRERPSNATIPMSPITAPQPPTDERTSIDSLSVSASSTRSRLMAEPYNKNMRSGRPSSSASTSSRSSIGNAAILESQQSTGVTGPTRPRSYIATGSLRMSSAMRTDSSGGGTGQDGSAASGERISGTALALALQRARGMSQGGPTSSSSSSSAMKLTRSSDALMASGSSAASSAKFRHSVALQRTALSSDGLKQAAAQRPQSLLETSSARMTGPSTKQTGAKVGFNEVSVALDTLRMFLKQKEQGERVDQSPHHDNVSTLPSTVETSQGSSPSKPGRTLRRTKAILPPRGAFSAVDEFGTLQTSSSTSHIPSPHQAPGAIAAHNRSHSLSSGLSGLSHPTRNLLSSSRRDDKLAVLQDLSERVMKLKAETERQKERHAAASMPPPPARLHYQRSHTNMTRREMHEEYLRKRANQP